MIPLAARGCGPQGADTRVRLRARNPLLGFNYGIVWQPLTKLEWRSRAEGR